MPLDVDLDHFPDVPAQNRPRPLYFDTALTVLSEAALRGRGYEVTQVKTLPRRNSAEHMLYLLAHLQGIEEKTIIALQEDRRRLQLELQAYGMLNPKTTRVNLNVDMSASEVREMLNWGKSRHTLRDNTTIVGVTNLQLHGAEAALEEKRKKSLKKLQEKKNAPVLRGEDSRSNKARPDGSVSRRKRSKKVGDGKLPGAP